MRWLLYRLRKHEEVFRSFTLRTARAGGTHGAILIQLCSLYASASAQQACSEDTRVGKRFTAGPWAPANKIIVAHLAVLRPTFGSSLMPLVDLTCWGASKRTGSRGLLQCLAAARQVSYGCVSEMHARHASWTQSRLLHRGKEPGGLLLPELHQ